MLFANTYINNVVVNFADCFSPLGMEDKRITDRQLRSSSYLSGLAVASYARLNNDEGYGGWCPNQTAYRNTTVPVYREFIQVKLDTALRIKGILLQGRAKGVEKVDRYWIAYASDKTDRFTWKWIRDQQSRSVKVRNFQEALFSGVHIPLEQITS